MEQAAIVATADVNLTNVKAIYVIIIIIIIIIKKLRSYFRRIL